MCVLSNSSTLSRRIILTVASTFPLHSAFSCSLPFPSFPPDYLAALLIDHKLYGRIRMQAVGFSCMFILILFSAIFYERLQKPHLIHYFQVSWHSTFFLLALHTSLADSYTVNLSYYQAMYYLTSFFTQFGPNCTTFLLAAEVYPTSIRSTCHGFSAACGKIGALIPAVRSVSICSSDRRRLRASSNRTCGSVPSCHSMSFADN